LLDMFQQHDLLDMLNNKLRNRCQCQMRFVLEFFRNGELSNVFQQHDLFVMYIDELCI
jgi:hypothetical protein